MDEDSEYELVRLLFLNVSCESERLGPSTLVPKVPNM